MLCSRGQLASETGLIRSPAKAACDGQFRAPCLTKLSSPGRRSRPIVSLGRLIDRNAPDFATVLAVCEKAAGGGDHATRKRVAKQIIKCARNGRTTLGELTAAGRRALTGIVPRSKQSSFSSRERIFA